jgi:predicted nuclease of predicted toxin-antitoxin system
MRNRLLALDKQPLNILFDQNVPLPMAAWLRTVRTDWQIWHVSEIGFSGKTDAEILTWASAHESIVITFDEDFADLRLCPTGKFYGVIRLRVWPTTIEETKKALNRLLDSTPDSELSGALIIIDNNRIRLRKR